MNHFEIIKKGVDTWNKWREQNDEVINLCGANLYRADLNGADLCGANLCGADLRGAELYGADLRGAYLYEADLRGAYLYRADLNGADLNEADLNGADLNGAENIFLFGPMPTSGRIVYAVRHDAGWMVQAGCFWGSVEELEVAVKKRHNCQVYLGVIELLKNSF